MRMRLLPISGTKQVSKTQVCALFLSLSLPCLATEKAGLQAEHLVREGNVLFDAGKYQEARAKYEAALESAPEWYEPHYELGQVYWVTKQFELSKKHYEQAISRKPDCGICYAGLGSLLDDMGNPQEALKHFDLATSHWPGSGKPHYNAAVTYLRLGKTEDAIAKLKAAQQIQPGYASPFFLLGNVYYKQGKLFLAFENLFQATKLETKGPRYDAAKKLIDAQINIDQRLKQDEMGVALSYCIARSHAQLIEQYRKRKPNAETYEGTLDDEAEVITSFANMMAEMKDSNKQAAKYAFLKIIADAGYMEPYLLLLLPDRFSQDREKFQQLHPDRIPQFQIWAAEKKIVLKPLPEGCEVKWMGRTW